MFIIAVVGILVNVALIAILGGHHHGPGHNHDHGHSHSHEDHSHAHSHDSDHAHADDHDHDHDHAHGNGLHAAEEGQACHSHGHSHGNGNINMQGAVMHVIGDLVQSIGVAIAGALIWWKQDDPRWALADPICTFIFAALVMWTTLSVMRDVADVLMERAPRGMDVPEIRRRMVEVRCKCFYLRQHAWDEKTTNLFLFPIWGSYRLR